MYLRWTLSWYFIVVEVHSIFTVLQLVCRYPLAVSIPSLCCYTCYFGVTAKSHLYPLISIIWPSWPSSLFTSTSLKVQSSLDCCIISMPLWRCSDLSIFDVATLHTKSTWTFFTEIKKVKEQFYFTVMQNMQFVGLTFCNTSVLV